MNIITGEKFQYLCDIYIAHNEFNKSHHIFNPTIYTNKCVSINNLDNNLLFLSSNKIFVHTSILTGRFDEFMTQLQKKKNTFILVFHNSDDIIDKKYCKIFDKTKCTRIFGQNICTNCKKIQFLPIGLANSKWRHGNKLLLNKIIKKNIEKENKIFFNFDLGTNRKVRFPCYETFKNNLTYTKFNNQEKYLCELKKCKFCICPEGNGPDCHRLWESLYLNVIPICVRSVFIEIISKDFPIYIIDKWDDLTIDNDLYNSYETYIEKLDIKKLNFDFWKEKIINK